MVWKVDIEGGRIRLRAPYNKRAVSALQAIPGGRWVPNNPLDKHRSFPISWEVCQAIRKAADKVGQDLDIGENLWRWAQTEQERQASIPDVNSMEKVELPNLAQANPKLYAAARPFQTVGIAFGARNREVLIADEPGLGKTLETIGAMQEAMVSGPILVVAPKAAASITWPHEIEKWSNGDKFGIIGSHMPARRRRAAIRYARIWCLTHPSERFWVITNVEYLRVKAEVDQYGNYLYVKGQKILKPVGVALLEFFEKPWSGVVVDESHRTLAGNSGNRKKWSAQRMGLGAIDVRKGGLRIALSGTPFRGKKENLWGTLNWLRPELYTSYWKWIGRHFIEFRDEMGGTVTTDQLKDSQAFYQEAAKVMIRRNKCQVAKDLPSKMYAGWPLDPDDPSSPVAVWLDMTLPQRRQYLRILKMGSVEIHGEVMMTHGILSEIVRLKQFANAPHVMEKDKPKPIRSGSNKMDWIENWLDERGMLDENPAEDVGKVVIASQFTSFLNMASTWFEVNGVPHHKLTGETSDKRRKLMQKQFQAPGGPRIFLLNTMAGGVSITLDAADDVIIVDQTTVPDDQEQVEDRAHRVSRPDHQVTIWYLASIGTIEEAIATKTSGREAELKDIIDTQRGVGVEFYKRLVRDHKVEVNGVGSFKKQESSISA